MNIKRLIASVLVMVYVFALAVVPAKANIQICYDGATHLYTGEVYKLFVNGNKIESAMEPIIFNDHALVPVREVFEECGATVDYDGDSRAVKVKYGSTRITMHINNNCAYINGKPVKIPDGVVPKLIYKPGDLTKTMVPVRFISESVGMKVDFNGQLGEIRITEPDKAPETTATPKPTPTVKPTAVPTVAPQNINITQIESEMIEPNKIQVFITCDNSVDGLVSYFDLSAPERVVTDLKGVKYAKTTEAITTGSDVIKSVRIGVDNDRARIVIDVEELTAYSVTTNGRFVTITASVTGDKSPTATKMPTATQKPVATQKPGTTPKPTAKPTATPKPTPVPDYYAIGQAAAKSKYNTGIVKANAENAKKLIMLDPGHGGSDPGAIGTLNGRAINEKDLTLSITYKVKAILESNGYKVAMTRTGDTLPTLAERPAMANQKNCALFVSIHINSATAEEANGTEVFFSEENNEDDYGITSLELAVKVLEGMLKQMKSRDRGVKMANWAVTRRADMPAILLEVGFISNQKELKLMCSDDYQNKTATGIAEGIINAIHHVKMP